MRFLAALSLILCGGLAASPAGTLAWQGTPTPPPDSQSLAEAAKKARDQQASQPKASKTFTNDSMKTAAPETPERPTAGKPAASKSPNTAALEKTYRAKFSLLRKSLKAAQADDKRLQEELAVVGPNSAAALHPYYDPATIQSLQSRIASNQKRMAGLKTQLDDLTDELRKKDLPARWAE